MSLISAMHNRLKSVAELSGVMVGVLILLAVIRVYVHYQYYNINIIPYLDFSEVVLSIFSDLKVLWRLLVMLTGNLLLVPLIWGLLVPIMARIVSRFRKSRKNAVAADEGRPVIQRMFSFEKVTSPKTRRFRLALGLFGFLLITLGVFKISGTWSKAIDDNTFYMWSIILSFGLFSITWGIVNHFYKSTTIVILILSFFIFILLGKHDPTLDKQNAHQERWTLATVSDTIYTSDTFYLAGRTNHYYFLYNSNNKTTDIIPVAEIKFARVQNIKEDTNRLRDIIRRGFSRLRGE